MFDFMPFPPSKNAYALEDTRMNETVLNVTVPQGEARVEREQG